MKTVKNIILVLIFGAIISFGLYIAPNYKKDITTDKINLVVNYTNVTNKMKGDIFISDDGNVYISKDDIENYYDKYIYYDEQYNYIIAASNGKTACFDILNETVSINDKTKKSKIINKDNMYYIPISDLKDVYNLEINYKKENNIIVIDSLDKELQTATVLNNTEVRYKNTFFSRNIEKLPNNSTVSIAQNNDENSEWILIRTENGNLGYIQSKYLSNKQIIRKEKTTETKKISLIWDYFTKNSKAPQNNENIEYNGINVVSPSFFYIEDSELKENVGESGINYINWAKSKDYDVWAMVESKNDTSEKKSEFSVWINDYKKRKLKIDQIVSYVKKYNLDGINIDFENINKTDKDALSRFIVELKPQLENIGAKLSVDVTVPDGSDSWSLCYDRNLIGDVADYIVIMAYDKVTRSSKPDSPAPYYWVENNINKFLNNEEVDSNKIILGIPLYTILWPGSDKGIFVSIKNINKYIPENTQVQWLEDEQQKYVEYTKNNITYKMWIEDNDSVSQKINLVKKYNLSGAAFWEKGYEDDNTFNVINKNLME